MLGAEETVARVLGELEERGVIRVEGGGPTGGRIVPGLRRPDPGVAAHMPGWLDYRRKFRDASRFWRLNRRPEDLIGGQSVEEAERYHDKDFVEQEFLRESRRRVAGERTKDRLMLFAACVGCIITLLILISYYFYALNTERQVVASHERRRHSVGTWPSASSVRRKRPRRNLCVLMSN